MSITPNFDDRPKDTKIDMLVMHYTGMKTGQEAFERLCDPAAKVSAHYIVYEDGSIVNLVKDEKRAWHAGISCWRGISALNDTSIGIEIVNPGHEWGYRQFPAEQMEAVLTLSKDLIERHEIEARNVVGHSDIAPGRKEDPGELFDWEWLAKNGVGLWPRVGRVWRGGDILVQPGKEDVDVARIQKMLADYGYHIRVDGFYGPKTEYIVKGFKRHFVPEQVNVSWDKLADARMRTLLKLVS
ncbi:MAG: N-acetylmuramoyl-L-alanine amidase [Rickettsiaceae bacterium]|jgi:N-acetylmuramoyl-L-alanine amidase|nr:N-acetylmuramoyl-L-alanine amidase [Rickettsiaceae bacterium]